MYRTNKTTTAHTAAAQCALALLSLCLILSLLPWADADFCECPDFDGVDDILVRTATPGLVMTVLLLEKPEAAQVARPLILTAPIPKPPIV